MAFCLDASFGEGERVEKERGNCTDSCLKPLNIFPVPEADGIKRVGFIRIRDADDFACHVQRSEFPCNKTDGTVTVPWPGQK